MVDDEDDCRAYVKDLLHDHPDMEEVYEAPDIDQAERLLRSTQVDLLILDVEMPGGTGFELLQRLGTWPFEVIFATGFQRYAVQAIRFSALDYLVKPVQPDELDEALQRFRKRHPDRDRSSEQRQFLSNLAQPDERTMKLTLTTGDRTWFIPPAEITHCTADDNYTELHVSDGRRFVSARTLKDYEEMLLPLGFLRVHRSALVNRAMITHLDGMHVVLSNRERIEVSRRKRDEVLKVLGS